MAPNWSDLSDAGVFVTPSALTQPSRSGKPVLRVCMTSELSDDEIRCRAEHRRPTFRGPRPAVDARVLPAIDGRDRTLRSRCSSMAVWKSTTSPKSRRWPAVLTGVRHDKAAKSIPFDRSGSSDLESGALEMDHVDPPRAPASRDKFCATSAAHIRSMSRLTWMLLSRPAAAGVSR